MNSLIDQISFGTTALAQECHHTRPSLLEAVSYCCCVATAFVGALYVLVPAKVRRLGRDNPLQIQWRTFATCTVCVGAILVYPFCFCVVANDEREKGIVGNQSVLERIGLFVPGIPLWNLFGALAHSIVLYMGPIALLLVQAKLMAQSQTQSLSPSPAAYVQALQALLFPARRIVPTEAQRTAERWIDLRSKVVAPILEEVTFRGCMVPALAATGLFHPWTVAWLAPLFFGLAHCHHAALKLKQGEPLSRVLLTTAFQFLYTSLFGAYCAHAFLRSRSLVAVMLSHSFCNTMGLPSLHFFNKTTPLYRYRIVLMKAHLLGIAIFAWGFTTATFLPLPADS